MRQIGFKNFRKFEDFHVIDLSPITIFVGENNAGKSTVVKAMLSIVDFLKSSMFDFSKTTALSCTTLSHSSMSETKQQFP